MFKQLVKPPGPCFFTYDLFDSSGNFQKRFNPDALPAIFIETLNALYMLTREHNTKKWITPAVIYSGAGGCTSPYVTWGAAEDTPEAALHLNERVSPNKFVLCEYPADVANYFAQYIAERAQ